MRVVVLQSNYIPWKGYFDLLNKAEKFIFYDDVQFTKNDWRNRNKIKTAKGADWISVPCGTDLNRLICEVKPSLPGWQKPHWDKIRQNYVKAPFFKEYKDFFEDFYLSKQFDTLSDINHYLIKNIARDHLQSKTVFDDSRNYTLEGHRFPRLLNLLKQCGATTYISGPAARNYFSEKDFEGTGISLEWMDYSGYPEYEQLFPPFDHYVSIIDLIFNTGPSLKNYLKT